MFALLALASAMETGPAAAGTLAPGRTVFSYEQIEEGARPAGLGGAFTALSDDSTAVSWNPAGLAMLSGFDMQLGYNSWFQGVGQSSVHAAGVGDRTGWGGTATFLSLPSSEQWGLGGNPTGSWSGRAMSASGGGGYRLGPDTSLGAVAGISSESLGRSGETGFSIGVGALHREGSLRFGATAMRVGTGAGGGNSPTDLRLGAAWVPSNGVVALEFHKPLDDVPSVVVGGEWTPMDYLSVRAGYRARIGGDGLSAIAGFSAGLGTGTTIGDTAWRLDYAFWPMGDLGPTHRVTIELRPITPSRAVSHGAAPALSGPTVSEQNGELVLTWLASDEPNVAGYNVYAAVGTDPLRRLTPSATSATTLHIRRPASGSGVVFHARIRPVDRKGVETGDTSEVSYTFH